MKRVALAVTCVLFFGVGASAQNTQTKFIADTLVVEAQGTYEADPDLATIKFDVSSQQKELNKAYNEATLSVQRIVNLAEKNGLKKEDVSTGVLTVRPFYEGDRKRKARSYLVQGEITLKVHDFSRVGPILDGSVEEGIIDLRSLTYSLSDEEAAKQRAVADAMRKAVGRANAALAEKGQKVGALRFANLDVKQLVTYRPINGRNYADQTVLMETLSNGRESAGKAAIALPQVHPEKVKVSATIQCAFQIL